MGVGIGVRRGPETGSGGLRPLYAQQRAGVQRDFGELPPRRSPGAPRARRVASWVRCCPAPAGHGARPGPNPTRSSPRSFASAGNRPAPAVDWDSLPAASSSAGPQWLAAAEHPRSIAVWAQRHGLGRRLTRRPCCSPTTVDGSPSSSRPTSPLWRPPEAPSKTKPPGPAAERLRRGGLGRDRPGPGFDPDKPMDDAPF